MAAGARHGLVAVVGLVAAAWLAKSRFAGHWPRLVRALLPVVVALDLGLAAMSLLVFAPASMLDDTPALAQLAHANWRGPGRPRLVRDPTVEGQLSGLARGQGLVHLEALRYATLRPSFLTAHGLATLPGYDAGLPPALERLWLQGQPHALALMRLLAVDFVVLPVPPGEKVPGLVLLGAPGPPGVGLYRVQAPLPRVYVAPRAQPLPGDSVAAEHPSRLFAPDVVAGTTVLLEGVPEAPPSAVPGGHGCTIRTYSHTLIEATCEAAAAAHAVFVEQFAAGWSATLDGAPAALLRANRLMRAVPLPPGRHDIALSYHQPGLAFGLVVSGAAALFVVAALIAGRRPRVMADAVAQPPA
jgi:hypothetical protein